MNLINIWSAEVDFGETKFTKLATLPCDDNIVSVDIQPKTLVARLLKILVRVGENIFSRWEYWGSGEAMHYGNILESGSLLSEVQYQ